MICPACGSENVQVSTVQENLGSVTTSKTKSKYKEKGHGIMWWLIFGWWWWIVDLCIWIYFFIPRLFVQIFKKKKYKGSSKTVATTVNNIQYVTVCTCQNCGKVWKINNNN